MKEKSALTFPDAAHHLRSAVSVIGDRSAEVDEFGNQPKYARAYTYNMYILYTGASTAESATP